MAFSAGHKLTTPLESSQAKPFFPCNAGVCAMQASSFTYSPLPSCPLIMVKPCQAVCVCGPPAVRQDKFAARGYGFPAPRFSLCHSCINFWVRFYALPRIGSACSHSVPVCLGRERRGAGWGALRGATQSDKASSASVMGWSWAEYCHEGNAARSKQSVAGWRHAIGPLNVLASFGQVGSERRPVHAGGGEPWLRTRERR